MRLFVPYSVDFSRPVNEEDKMKTTTGSDIIAKQETHKPDIIDIPLSRSELDKKRNDQRNAKQITNERNRVRKPSDYLDFENEISDLKKISSRGMIFSEKQLEIDGGASTASMLPEFRMINGRTQL